VRFINFHYNKLFLLNLIEFCYYIVKQEKQDTIKRAEEYLAKAAQEAQ
jgi:ABC-type histidine transport system ATPase subunit